MAVVLLVLVLIPGFGVRVKGARRWLSFAHLGLQPSELAKIALIICLAHYGERYQRHMSTFVRGILVPCTIIGAVLGLIFVEPDRGTTILLVLVSGIMLVIAGVRWRFIIPPALAVVAALAFSFWHDPMRSDRIYSWLHLEETKQGKGLQAYQAMVALGSGGWTGVGLGNGRQKLGWVPEHHTDFIFAMVGEELGLIATIAVLVAFVLIVVCGIYISSRAHDPFGLLLGSGLTFLIGLQAFINMGVVTGALPNKGMALPFISYGGSSLVVLLIAVGLLLSIARLASDTERERIKTIQNPFADISSSQET
jgi:cell division protein FtsW